MKRTSIYATMTASDLARVTRERGLKKPNVITLSEWADFLEADDAKRLKKEQAQQKVDASEADTEPTQDTPPDTSSIEPLKAKKGKS